MDCNYCKKPIENNVNYITILDEFGDFQSPILQIHNSCAYDVKDALDKIIKKLELRLDDTESSN